MFLRYCRITRALCENAWNSTMFQVRDYNIVRRFVPTRNIMTTPPSKTTISVSASDTPATVKRNALSSSTVFESYRRFHDKKPYTTQALQSLLVGLVGDSLSQLLLAPDEEYSPLRTFKVMITGSILSLPTFAWVKFMAKNINHSNMIISVALKVVANQLCFAPFFLSSFLTTGFLAQGILDPGEIIDRLKQRVPIAWMNGCMFWPNIVILNFTLVPPHFRGLVNSAASVVWQAYLSWLTFSSKNSVQVAIDKEVAIEQKVGNAVSETLHLDQGAAAARSLSRE
ncbi:hypothetical protein V1517DRAFT_315681 [Lipomyces orientalis]|uniref:Uncharacterized protein n=1 Tax=Lipomyces orientalis TaxID=1233043 RepID=A0ACC3TUX6_9ASCO